MKFVSGVLALSSGYALGREGPVVQMGAYIGGVFGRHHWASEQDRRILVASLAGAGAGRGIQRSGTGGLLFALEELTHVARTRLVTISMIACAVAVPVTQFILGPQPVFQVPALAEPSLYVLPFYVLGVLTGFAGVLYNSAILGGLSLFMWLDMVPFWRWGAACAMLALLVWFVPEFAGGGEQLVQQLLSGPWLLATLPVVAGAIGAGTDVLLDGNVRRAVCADAGHGGGAGGALLCRHDVVASGNRAGLAHLYHRGHGRDVCFVSQGTADRHRADPGDDGNRPPGRAHAAGLPASGHHPVLAGAIADL